MARQTSFTHTPEEGERERRPIVYGWDPRSEEAEEPTRGRHNRPRSPPILYARIPLGVTILPQYRLVDYEHFKNWYTDSDASYAIDAYIAKPSTCDLQDIRKEKQRRKQRFASHNLDSRGRAPPLDQQRSIDGEETNTIPGDGIIQRVRIKSRPVLLYLLNLAGRPRHRSYDSKNQMKEALIKLEAKWANFEQEQSSKDSATSTAGVGTGQTERELENPVLTPSVHHRSRSRESMASSVGSDFHVAFGEVYDSDSEAIMDSIEALQHLRCYVAFVDEHIMPLSHLFDTKSTNKVRFDDLSLLFKPGENIFVRSRSGYVDGQQSSGRSERELEKWEPYQRVWRVCEVTTAADRLKTGQAKTGRERSPVRRSSLADFHDKDAFRHDCFDIRCFYLDFDGLTFQPVSTRLSISQFNDEIDITSLPCYPIRYCENSDQMLKDLTTVGRRFHNAVADKRFYYSGISLERSPDGSFPSKRPSGKLIESEVVIDFEEAYLQCSWLRPRFMPLSNLAVHERWQVDNDEIPLLRWNSTRGRRVESIVEKVQVEDIAEARLAKDWIARTSETTWHAHIANPGQDHKATVREEAAAQDGETEGSDKSLAVLDEDLVLVTTRVCDYAFKEKGFFMLDLRKLQPVMQQRGVFEALKIPREYKEMVRGLVSSHFEKKRIDRLLAERFEGSIDQDIIQGKGKGLVILLHGVPGVGKTATAEAVAKENQEPLFTVTYGDLGTSPSELEAKLEDLFHLATRWDCVLLFDEADVFLAERSRTELKRNALVSVFLRVLEYYHGILFLTTNRVGSIDEAFKSRLHMMLYYPPLGRAQTIAIFKANIAKLKEIERQKQRVVDTPPLRINEDSIVRFAERHYDNGLPDGGRWNGRQIKNAFQIAASLAHYKARAQDSEVQSRGDGSKESKGDATVPVLDETHFMNVEKATQDFGQYITQAKGFTDAKWAKMSSLRHDEFQHSAAHGDLTARNSSAPHPTHASGGAGHGVYGTGHMADSYQPDGSFQADGHNYPYRGRSHHGGQAGYEEYGTSSAHYPQSQPPFHDPYRHHNSAQMGQGTLPSRSPVPSTASAHGPGFRQAPGREDFGMPAQRGGNYERYSEVPRPAVHDDDGEDAYN